MDLQPSMQITPVASFFDGHLLASLLIMVAAGLLGGLFNYYLTRHNFEENREEARHYVSSRLRRYLTFGLVVSLSAPPLLLSVLSSGLLESARFKPSEFYSLAALCLVCVVVAHRLFHSPPATADRQKLGDIQKELEVLKREQVRLYQYLEDSAVKQELKEASKSTLTYNDAEILRALSDANYVYGNLAALTEKTGLGRELLSQRLAILKEVGLIDTRIADKNVLHWVISARGQQVLSEIRMEPNTPQTMDAPVKISAIPNPPTEEAKLT